MSTSSISGRTSSSSGSKPRPKPRPRYRKDNADATSSSNVTPPLNSTSYPDISKDMDFSASNIADRAKTRTRNKSQANESTALTSEVIELSSDGDDDFSLIPAPKARRKVADKAKALRKSKPAFDDADTPDSKPRPRPRPVGKPKQGKSSDPTSPFAGAISQETNPIPPSSMLNDQFPIPFKLLPSQLPPSDPPTSTAATYDHPPIVTLPQLDTDQEPHSSPSSLFSVDASVGKQKRKRDMSNVDELDSDQGSGIANRIDAETRRMPPPPPPGPPPTFFAGSSSPPLELGRPIASTSTDIEVPSKKRPAAKKSRKKKAVTTDDEDGAWGTSKPKAKSRSKKAPAKKVEVVIERPKAKGKGKEKENGVFKSREFIDDDEDDRMMDHDVDISIFEKPDSLTSLSSIPDSDLEAARKAEPSKKRKSVDRGLPEYDPSGGDGDPPEPKRRAVTQSKGRKLVVSDDEDDDVQNAAKPATYNKTPAQASGKAKGKEKSTKSNKIPKATNADSEVEDSLGPSKQPDEEGSPSTTYKVR
ncbi:hypothetical protein FPV67DRAFT_902981 [Lyophyllum atratum]|nr:hypothetical protein FPV67DRAFT_902981 [Lyophyllum atratum]